MTAYVQIDMNCRASDGALLHRLTANGRTLLTAATTDRVTRTLKRVMVSGDTYQEVGSFGRGGVVTYERLAEQWRQREAARRREGWLG